VGGRGSGRRWGFGRPTVGHFERQDVRDLAREWSLKSGGDIGFQAWDGQQCVRQWVTLSWTPCHFGGMRPWFNCPGCGRCVAILYRGPKWWLCRTCLGLTYQSSQEGKLDRALRRVCNLRRRLDGSETILDPWPVKPPRMHQRAYLRLMGALRAATEEVVAYAAAWLPKPCTHIQGSAGDFADFRKIKEVWRCK
jgi:hypothetical protein